MADPNPDNDIQEERDRRALAEVLASLGEDPSVEGFLQRHTNILYEEDYEPALDVHVQEYRRRLRRRSRETADGAGSLRISRIHVDHAAMSLAFRQRDSGLLQTTLGVAASVAGTVIGLLVSQFDSPADSRWSGTVLGLTAVIGLAAIAAAVSSATTLWLRSRNG